MRKYRVALVSFILILMAMAIISSHRKSHGRLNPFERVVYAIARPLQWSISSGYNSLRSLWEGYIALVHLQRENQTLKERIRELEQLITDHEEIKAANLRLRRLLDFQRSVRFNTVTAQVIGEDSTGWFHTLLIDKGRAHELQRGMPVTAPDGIVGQIIECADRTSKVMMIIDRNSAVDITIQRSRTRGVLEGTGQWNTAILKYVARTADVREGDRVITSGLGGIYPKGQLVGQVTSVKREGYGLFQRVEVAPQVDFQRLEEVLVVSSNGGPSM